ncbi:MAG TPA: alpha/beta fold hydrolase [Chloroflexota bacterium]
MPTVQANGIRVGYEEVGQGEPVLLIPGTGVDRTLWSLQVSALHRRYRCIAMDNRGVGESDKPAGDYTMRLLAADAAGLLESLGVARAHVVGQSLGSAVAQELAIHYPERVLTLSLHGTWARTADAPYLARLFQVRRDLVRSAPWSVYLREGLLWLFTPEYVDAHEAEIALREEMGLASPASPEGLLGQYAASLAHDTADRLGEIVAPTLVTVGAEDRVTVPAYGRQVHERIPGSDFVVFPRLGHLSMVQAPDVFNATLLDFLGRHPM